MSTETPQERRQRRLIEARMGYTWDQLTDAIRRADRVGDPPVIHHCPTCTCH